MWPNSGTYTLRVRIGFKAIKNICYSKGEGTVDPQKITRWFKHFVQVRRFTTIRHGQIGFEAVAPEAVIQAIDVNTVCNAQRI